MWPSLVDLVVQEDLDAGVREAVEVVDVVVETEEDMEVDVEEVGLRRVRTLGLALRSNI